MKNESMVAGLIDRGALHTSDVERAFSDIDRKDFVPANLQAQAYYDTALPIGWGQTISQPTTVAFMLELLQAHPGDRVLDVGSGSGWTTALLADIVGEDGNVIGTEVIPDIATLGRLNLAKYHFKNANIRLTESLGAPEEAPFDRILVSAATDHVPRELMDQLQDNSVLVMPVGSAIVRVHKNSQGHIGGETFEGFAFVPLHY